MTAAFPKPTHYVISIEATVLAIVVVIVVHNKFGIALVPVYVPVFPLLPVIVASVNVTHAYIPPD